MSSHIKLIRRFDGWSVTVSGKPVAEFVHEHEAVGYRNQLERNIQEYHQGWRWEVWSGLPESTYQPCM